MFVSCAGKKLLWQIGFGSWLTVCIVSAAIAETVYRCDDGQGRTLFQQIPCAGSSEKMEVKVDNSIWAPVDHAGKIIARGVKKPKRQPRITRAQSDKQKKACWKADQKIQRIQWKLRKGYTAAQGERLRQQRREAEDYKRDFCQ